METLRNLYFPILPCKYFAKALLLTDKGDAAYVFMCIFIVMY